MLVLALMAGAIGVAPPDKAVDVVKALIAALGVHQGFSASIEGERVLKGVAQGETAEVVVRPGPPNYWSKAEAIDGVEYAWLKSLKLSYTDDNGNRKAMDVPSPRVILNYASVDGLSVWDTLCDVASYQAALPERVFYVQSEEVEGNRCDVVGILKTTPDESKSTGTSIRYVWVDQKTRLPRAFQRHTFVRGWSDLGPKWVFTKLADVPPGFVAEVPNSVPRTVARAENVASPPSVTFHAGDRCPAFVVESPDGVRSGLPSLIKGRTLVTLWAPWCGPCREELEALTHLPQVTGGKVQVIAVGVDDSKQNIRAIAAKGSRLLHFYADTEAEHRSSKLFRAFAPDGAIPHAYLYDAKGTLIREWLGFRDAKELEKRLAG